MCSILKESVKNSSKVQIRPEQNNEGNKSEHQKITIKILFFLNIQEKVINVFSVYPFLVSKAK